MVAEQSFSNHIRYVVGYHVVTFAILVLNLLWCVTRLFRSFSADAVVTAALAVALLLLFYYAGKFALTVQDRVIRLEMRLRLREVLPPDLVGRIADLSLDQLVALRFASDLEMPDLIRRILAESIHDRTVIKRMVKSWQPDHLRA
jgi:hypothetical protein